MSRGKRILRARKRLRMTQEELQHATGVAQRLISELENDKRPNVSAAILDKLAHVLGVSLDYLQRGEDVYDGECNPAGENESDALVSPGRATS